MACANGKQILNYHENDAYANYKNNFAFRYYFP